MVDPEHALEARQRRALLIITGIFLFGLAFGLGFAAHSLAVTLAARGIAVGSASAEDDLLLFREAWGIVQDRFVYRENLDSRRMIHGALRGMVDALGDEGHTRFLTPDELRHSQEALSGKLEGIGAEISIRDGRPVIVAAIEGSPAARGGLQAGDVILAVGGEDTARMPLTELTRKVRGPRDSQVTLTLLRPSTNETREVTLTREEIQLRVVTWTMVPGTTIAHLHLAHYSERARDELVQALGELRAAGATALVLDLRDDPGGLLDQAVQVTSQFIAEGNVLLEEDAARARKPYPVQGEGAARDLPLVVLVNRGTASAAEITAGAIQDHGRGLLVGETTFGTGTVLATFPLRDGSALLLGVAQWLTPNGRAIRGHGIPPDINVSLPAGVSRLQPRVESGMTPEQLEASGDTQLLAAIAHLR